MLGDAGQFGAHHVVVADRLERGPDVIDEPVEQLDAPASTAWLSVRSIACPSRPSRADFQYAARSACGASGARLSPRRSASSAVITAALISAASSTVSATVAGTSATRTSIVGKLADGRTSQ